MSAKGFGAVQCQYGHWHLFSYWVGRIVVENETGPGCYQPAAGYMYAYYARCYPDKASVEKARRAADKASRTPTTGDIAAQRYRRQHHRNVPPIRFGK